MFQLSHCVGQRMSTVCLDICGVFPMSHLSTHLDDPLWLSMILLIFSMQKYTWRAVTNHKRLCAHIPRYLLNEMLRGPP